MSYLSFEDAVSSKSRVDILVGGIKKIQEKRKKKEKRKEISIFSVVDQLA
jgi:hypothetical protein